jgi:uncharacterized protein YcaQ
MVHSVTKNVLSSYLIHYHFLDCIDRLTGEAGIKSLFQRIGSVQYDPLDIVGRNPHLVLQSRVRCLIICTQREILGYIKRKARKKFMTLYKI